MVILKESYANYENKQAAPAHHDVNRGFTMPLARWWRDEALNNAQEFLKMQLFRAALPAKLRKVVAQKNPNMLTLVNMYQIATDTQRDQDKDQASDRSDQPGGRRRWWNSSVPEEEGFQKLGSEEVFQSNDQDGLKGVFLQLQEQLRTQKQC